MTDRPLSCRQSPNGRHRFTVSPLMCDYCSRTTTYLTDMGWNAPANDPDAPIVWEDQEADVNDAPRRADGPYACAAQGPWLCERQPGHTGQHMAWCDYERRILYPDGAWD